MLCRSTLEFCKLRRTFNIIYILRTYIIFNYVLHTAGTLREMQAREISTQLVKNLSIKAFTTAGTDKMFN